MKKRNLSFDEIDSIKSIDDMQINHDAVATVYGVGVNDVDFVIGAGFNYGVCRQYKLWSSILKRCYDSKYHQECPTYVGCKISDDWIYFSDFLVWCNNQVGFFSTDKDGNHFHLDKDVLSVGGKMYSPTTCVFIPAHINSLLTKRDNDRGKLPVGVCLEASGRYKANLRIDGRKKHLGMFDTELEAFSCYKAAKEAECKRVANVYRDYISDAVYKALMKYEVSIDD